MLFFISACGSPEGWEHEETFTRQEALQGNVSFTTNGRLTCSTSDVSAANATTFGTALRDATRLGRSAATSSAMYGCLHNVMVTGGVSFDADHAAGPWGPYDFNVHYGDAFLKGVLATASADMKRRLQTLAVWNLGQSVLDVRADCDPAAGGAGYVIPPSELQTSWFQPEVITFFKSYINGTATEFNAGGTRRNRRLTDLAALVWHEAMHVHGYRHGGTADNHKVGVTHVVGACMFEVVEQSLAVCPNTCPTGEVNIVNALGSNTCTCHPDPGVPQTTTAVVTQSSGVTDFAVDSAGRSYIVLGGDVWRHPKEVTNLGRPSGQSVAAVYAGGFDVFVKTTSNGVYRGRGASDWETIWAPSASPVDVAIDDFGTVYVRTSSDVRAKRIGEASLRVIGGPASRLFAGGDRVYATSPNGSETYMYDHAAGTWTFAGGPGAQFASDSRGVAFGLSPEKQAVYRNHASANGIDWRWVGGPATSITAGARLYRTTNGHTFELYPNGTWQQVSSAQGQIVKERGGFIYGLLNGRLSRLRH